MATRPDRIHENSHNYIPTFNNSVDRQQSKIIDPNHLIRLRKLGQGFSSVVQLMSYQPPGHNEIQVAVKNIHNMRFETEDSLREMNLISECEHKNIVKFIGYFTDDFHGNFHLVTEFMPGGDLHSYLCNESNRPSIQDFFSYILQIADGMEYLTHKHLIHRDLAARNCLLDISTTIVKITDFGLSRKCNFEYEYISPPTTLQRQVSLPIRWTAIEVLHDPTIFSDKSDVWSYGVVIWEIFTCGEQPYGGKSQEEIKTYLFEGQRLEQPANMPNDLYRITRRCWEELPRNRPKFGALKAEINLVFEELITQNSDDFDIKYERPTSIVFEINEEPIPESQIPENSTIRIENNKARPTSIVFKINEEPIPENSTIQIENNNAQLSVKFRSSKSPAIYEEQFNSHTMLNSSFNYDKLVFDNQTTEYKFILEDFKFIELINSSRNVVNKYEHIESRKIVAIKSVIIPFKRQPSSPGTPTSDNQSKKLEQEVSTLLSVGNHKNIINFYGVSIQDNKLLICMEYMDLTLMNLYSIVHEHESCFPENLLGAVTTAILNALNFCKSLNYMHRDIKPDNILVNWSGEIKLADFGEARLMEDSIASTLVGTLLYLAPERFEVNLGKYDVRVDVWSLGMTLLECMYGYFPIKDKDGNEISHISCGTYIKQLDKVNLINNCPQKYADFVYEFLSLCLKEYENRPKYNGLMQTEFYLKYNAEISQPSSVASILARYGSKMKFASTNFVQQSDVFHSGDQKSFLNKSDYINYLTQERNVPCLEKNINFEEFIRSIDDGYVFLCCWNEVISNINEDDAFNENYDGELQYFDELLNDQKTCLFVDQDLMLNPIFPNQCRICQIKNGKICVEDLLNRYQA